MSDRGRQVYALLRTLNDWVPTPRNKAYSEQPGFAAHKTRYVSCPDCLANGHPDGMAGCETCRGRGEIPDFGPDPYQQKTTGFYADEERAHREDMDARREWMLRQLADQERERDGLEARSDTLTRALAEADRSRRAGSYAELERCLERLRTVHEGAYRVCCYVAYGTFGPCPVEPIDRVVRAACEILASWMPPRIRVPAGVPVFTRDELEREAAILRERAQWRGRTDPLARARRDEAIRAFKREGLSAAVIAVRIGVHRRTVERTLNGDRSEP